MSAVAIEELVAKLRCCKSEHFDEVDHVRELLRASPADPESLSRYLIWDGQHYTRNLIDKTPLYELRVQNYRVLREDLNTGACDIEPSDTVEISPSSPTAVNPLQPVHSVYNPAE